MKRKLSVLTAATAIFALGGLALPANAASPAASDYIRGLNYDPQIVVSHNPEGVKNVPVTQSSLKDGTFTVTTYKVKKINNASADLSVAEANNSVIFPGAVVLANSDLANGAPTQVSLPRDKQTVSIDLPGLLDGKNSVTVTNPQKGNVDSGINTLVENWRKAGVNYPNSAARISFDESMVTSKKQLEAKFGVTIGEIADQLGVDFDAIHSRNNQTAIANFKQVYYTVNAQSPAEPGSVFSNKVTADSLKKAGINDKNPPAFVSSVSYGRQIFVKLESKSTSTEVKAAFNAAFLASIGKIDPKIDPKYSEILKETKFKALIMGGSGDVQAKIVTGGIGQLKKAISAEAAFSPKVPVVPVSYSVNYLKDNKRAIVKNNGEYVEATTTVHTRGFVTLKHTGGYVAKFNLSWDEITFDKLGEEVRTRKQWDGNDKSRTAGFAERVQLPPNARNISIKAVEATGLVWDPWWKVINETNVPLVGERTVTISGTTLAPSVTNIVK